MDNSLILGQPLNPGEHSMASGSPGAVTADHDINETNRTDGTLVQRSLFSAVILLVLMKNNQNTTKECLTIHYLRLSQ